MSTWNHYIDHDRTTGAISFKSQPSCDYSTPFSVYHGREGRYGLPRGVHYDDEAAVVEWARGQAGDLMAQISTLGSVEWDGHNHVWHWTDETAAERGDDIEQQIDEIIASCPLGAVEWDASDWYLSGLSMREVIRHLGLSSEMTVDEIEAKLVEDCEDATDGSGREIRVTDLDGFAKALRDRMRDED